MGKQLSLVDTGPAQSTGSITPVDEPIRVVPYPDWYRPSYSRSRKQNERVLRGLHPTGEALGPEGSSCKTCIKRYRVSGARTWNKCEMQQHTNGPASDILVSWRGCRHWEPRLTMDLGIVALSYRMDLRREADRQILSDVGLERDIKGAHEWALGLWWERVNPWRHTTNKKES